MSGIAYTDEDSSLLHPCPQCKQRVTAAPLCDVCTAAVDGILAGTLERFRADSDRDAKAARERWQSDRDEAFKKLIDDNAVPVEVNPAPRSVPGLEPGGKKRA
jgi:hypothetical protein